MGEDGGRAVEVESIFFRKTVEVEVLSWRALPIRKNHS